MSALLRSFRRSMTVAVLVLTTTAALLASALTMSAPAAAATSTVVSLTFNDGHSSQYAYARPVLQAHSVNATFYVASGWVDAGSNSSMSWSQVRDLYRDGDEIGGMGKDHKSLTATYFTDPSQDLAYKQSQVCDDRQRLIAMGVDPQTFAYPQAAVDATAKSIVSGCGYRAGRTIGGLSSTSTPYAETIPPADAFSVRTANVPTGAITLSSLQSAVNAAYSHGGGWLPISFNQVCHQGTSNYNACMSSSKPIDDVVFSQFLDWLNNTGQAAGAPAGTTVKTVRGVMGASAPPPLPVDPTTVSLTFNDGLVTGYTNARPVLKAHNMNGTFYVVSSWVDSKASGYMASWQLDQLYQDGNEIGGEGRDHKDLTQTYYSDPTQDAAYKRRSATAGPAWLRPAKLRLPLRRIQCGGGGLRQGLRISVGACCRRSRLGVLSSRGVVAPEGRLRGQVRRSAQWCGQP
jgi:peptidoglycan/xylan/chitin deacetylase (PgdA/CDA1 family)